METDKLWQSSSQAKTCYGSAEIAIPCGCDYTFMIFNIQFDEPKTRLDWAVLLLVGDRGAVNGRVVSTYEQLELLQYLFRTVGICDFRYRSS